MSCCLVAEDDKCKGISIDRAEDGAWDRALGVRGDAVEAGDACDGTVNSGDAAETVDTAAFSLEAFLALSC